MKSRQYIAVEWRHAHAHEPALLLSELDAGGWEQRKVEVFRDGTMGYANADSHSTSTRLGEAPVPGIEEIAKNPEFSARLIAQEEFERVWAEARP